MSSNVSHRSMGLLFGVLVFAAGCPPVSEYPGDAVFQRLPHSLFPPTPVGDEPWHLGSGAVTGEGPAQPIQFSHHRHVTEIGIQCEYCHDSARKSIHGGVPGTQTCMNCHQYVAKDKPEIQKLTEYWTRGEPIPWSKVHDVADFVHFNHSRHVQGGVQCTECHGQIGQQGQYTQIEKRDEHGKVVFDEHGQAVTERGIEPGKVMVRETTMQMGWCLECHGSHPSIDKNYGEKANLRRAELKDCWTCHK